MSVPTRLQTLLDSRVSGYPDKTAIYFESRSYSYRQLQQLTQKLAYGLQENGIVSSDRVALFLPNCPEAVMVFLACYQLGTIAVPLNYRYQAEEARYVIEQTGTNNRSDLCHDGRVFKGRSFNASYIIVVVFLLSGLWIPQ